MQEKEYSGKNKNKTISIQLFQICEWHNGSSTYTNTYA